jgi:hypothetical protein
MSADYPTADELNGQGMRCEDSGQELRILEIRLPLGRLEYPDKPISLALFFRSATVQSS